MSTLFNLIEPDFCAQYKGIEGLRVVTYKSKAIVKALLLETLMGDASLY